MLASFLTTIFWALSAICGNRSAKLIGGTEANFWRLSLATVFLALWAHVFGQGLAGWAFPIFFISGVIGIGVGDLAYFQTLTAVGPRLSLVLVHCLTAPFAAAIEWIWLGTKLTPSEMACGMLTLVGIGISLSPDRMLHLSRKEAVRGVLFSLLSALCGAVGAVLSRKAYLVAAWHAESVDGGTGAYQRLTGGMLVAGAFLLVVKWRAVRGHLTLSDENPALPSREKWRRAGPWILANALTGQTLGVSCYQWALQTTPTGVVLPIVATTPLIAIPFTMMIDRERLKAHSIVGDVLAVAGVVGLTLLQLHHPAN